jgi:adenosine deaminase
MRPSCGVCRFGDRAERDELGLTTAQLETLALNSFDASFAPPELREAWKDEVHAWSTQQATGDRREVADDA